MMIEIVGKPKSFYLLEMRDERGRVRDREQENRNKKEQMDIRSHARLGFAKQMTEMIAFAVFRLPTVPNCNAFVKLIHAV